MERSGCFLPATVSARATRIRERLPDWDETMVDAFISGGATPTSFMDSTTDSSVFEGVAVSRIVDVALEHTSRVDQRRKARQHFDAMVRESPARALSGLAYVARKGQFPENLWTALVKGWPSNAPCRATMLLCFRILRLPDKVINADPNVMCAWMEEYLPEVAAKNEPLALAVFDGFLPKLECKPQTETSNDHVEVQVMSNGRFVRPSRRTSSYANAGSFGIMTKTLISMLAVHGQSGESETLEKYTIRLNQFLAMPGEASDHAICLMSQKLGWLYEICPDWVSANILPCFEFDSPESEPAWMGFLSGAWEGVTPELFLAIKTQFLALFPKMYAWRGGDGNEFKSAHVWLVKSAIRYRDDPYTSKNEAKQAISNASKFGRADMIHFLTRIGQEGKSDWYDRVIPFLRDTWPNEKACQSDETSLAFFQMLCVSGKSFPDLFQATRYYLQPTIPRYSSLNGLCNANDMDEIPIAQRFPREALELIDKIVSNDPMGTPSDLGDALAMISEACPELKAHRSYTRLRKLLDLH